MNNSTTDRKPPSTKGLKFLALGFSSYSILVIIMSVSGVFSSINANLFALTVVAATLMLLIPYFLVPSVKRLATKIGPYGFAYFHLWRVPAALAFLYYGSQGWLPDIFVNLAGWGDMIAGVLAAIVLLIPRSKNTILGFHIAGFIDFLVAVGTGIVLNAIDPVAMENIVRMPIALIPLIGVPLSGATHIISFHLLKTNKGKVAA